MVSLENKKLNTRTEMGTHDIDAINSGIRG